MKAKHNTLSVYISPSRTKMGEDAAWAIQECIEQLLQEQEEVNMIFAAAPSQLDLFQNLKMSTIPWSEVNAFHMDEYIGIEHEDTASFRHFLDEHLFDHIPLKSIHYIKGEAIHIEEECQRYARLLYEFPPDIVCMGIGENTHIAFNDPPADFQDTLKIKEVVLDQKCRQQQVNDGCFSSIGAVPTKALTLTIPMLMSAKYVFCVVPGERKAEAVYHTLKEDVNEDYPSTILRTHPNASLYLDADSSRLVIS